MVSWWFVVHQISLGPFLGSLTWWKDVQNFTVFITAKNLKNIVNWTNAKLIASKTGCLRWVASFSRLKLPSNASILRRSRVLWRRKKSKKINRKFSIKSFDKVVARRERCLLASVFGALLVYLPIPIRMTMNWATMTSDRSDANAGAPLLYAWRMRKRPRQGSRWRLCVIQKIRRQDMKSNTKIRHHRARFKQLLYLHHS